MEKAKNELVIKLFDQLKNLKISVPKFSGDTGIPTSRVYKWERQGTNPKTDDVAKIEEWLSRNDVDIYPNIREDKPNYGRSLSERTLLNLTESNSILSQSNKTLAEANKTLADNTVLLTAAYTRNIVGGDPGISLDVLATIQALQEYLPEIAAQVKKTSVAKTAAELGIKMTEKRKALGKKGNRADAGK